MKRFIHKEKKNATLMLSVLPEGSSIEEKKTHYSYSYGVKKERKRHRGKEMKKSNFLYSVCWEIENIPEAWSSGSLEDK